MPYRCASCSELIEDSGGMCAECFAKLNFITSPYCQLCGVPFEFAMEGQALCGKCIITPPKYDLGRSLLKFDQHSKNLIHAFKYNDKTSHAKMFAKLIIARYANDLQDVEFIIPVPMHRIKRLVRNYNPAQVLSTELAKLLKKRMLPDGLIKTKWTKAQTTLSRSERMKNLTGSIRINEKYDIKDRVILLIDDVRTTGTTSNTCSNLLKKAGAACVKLVTIGVA
ncbi:MAG: amidophosphoribosyltransferase [Rickettsiales bacterium]|nr:MAG: amidophosphoribosyltransferase [Rickettsiales bacterium]